MIRNSSRRQPISISTLPGRWRSSNLTIWAGSMNQPGATIFEGAQGVLLDEWYGFYPYNTWSTLTFKNADALLSENSFTGESLRLGHDTRLCHPARRGSVRDRGRNISLPPAGPSQREQSLAEGVPGRLPGFGRASLCAECDREYGRAGGHEPGPDAGDQGMADLRPVSKHRGAWEFGGSFCDGWGRGPEHKSPRRPDRPGTPGGINPPPVHDAPGL